jgi:hypothetical protein
MRFWRLTLGFAFLGALGGGIYGDLAWRAWYACSGDGYDILCFSRGDYITMYGFFGLVLGAALGLVVWALWRLANWWIGFGYDEPRMVRPPERSSPGRR